VALHGEDGAAVWRAEGLVPSGPNAAVAVTVPARVLVAASYELRVEGEALRDTPQASPTVLVYGLRLVRR